MRSALGKFVRSVVTWAIMVIAAFNLENQWVSLGISDLLPFGWCLIVAWLEQVRNFATTPWVWGVTLFLLGMVTYEWLVWAIQRMERENSSFKKRRFRKKAGEIKLLFDGSKIMRRFIDSETLVRDFNDRAAAFDMRPIPPLAENENINAVFARYVGLIEADKFGEAADYLSGIQPYLISEADRS